MHANAPLSFYKRSNNNRRTLQTTDKVVHVYCKEEWGNEANVCREFCTGSLAARTHGGSNGLTRRMLTLRTTHNLNYLLLLVTRLDVTKAYPQYVCSLPSKDLLVVLLYSVLSRK